MQYTFTQCDYTTKIYRFTYYPEQKNSTHYKLPHDTKKKKLHVTYLYITLRKKLFHVKYLQITRRFLHVTCDILLRVIFRDNIVMAL